MNETATRLSPLDAPSGHRLRLRTRFLVYFSVWTFAALAIEIFLRPEGITETDFSPLQQRLLWPLWTPLMVVVGLAQAFTWPDRFPTWVPWTIVVGFAVHFIIALTRVRRSAFLVFTCIQILTLAVAVVYFIRQSYLPDGG